MKINLFKTEKSGLVPTTNNFIESRIQRIIKASKKKYNHEAILARVKLYYKVVGIIFLGSNLFGLLTGLWVFYEDEDDSFVQDQVIPQESVYIDP